MRNKSFLITLFIVAVGLFLLEPGNSPIAQTRGTKPLAKEGLPAPIAETVLTSWFTVVNNDYRIPNGTRNFSSYGQPSVNTQGTVVFRGRSTRGVHETGMFMRRFHSAQVLSMADLTMQVPDPNNLGTKFREFSSFPRIAMNEDFAAFLGMHSPVYRYILPDETETRVGTTGIYVDFNRDPLFTGASKLGAVPGLEHFSVPMFKAHMFDVFPGGAAVSDNGTIVFKANWTENDVNHKTGIFARELTSGDQGGFNGHRMIASSDTEIPGLPPMLIDGELVALTFDSTSPPTIAGNTVVFLGLDYELDPHFGGIYLVPVTGGDLEPLIEIGKPLPNLDMAPVIRLGEGLSWDGRYLGFWAAWGNEFKTIRTNCPEDGNADLIAFCNGVDPNSILDEETGEWYQLQRVPVEQGIIVFDTRFGKTFIVARNQQFTDFVFWTYSGHVPGTDGDADAEFPRWRSSAFMTVFDGAIAFKGRRAEMNAKYEYVNITDGLYLVDAPISTRTITLAETGMDGSILDPSLPPGAMPITGLGIERDGLRGQYLAITATMANEEAGWGGVYLTTLTRRTKPGPNPETVDTTPMFKTRNSR
jgi:hypothetical protein